MKILLIMPEFQTHTRFYKRSRWHFPFSIWYLGTYYKSLGHDIQIMDNNISLVTELDSYYDEIGISCITAQIPKVRRIAEFFYNNYTKAKRILGGIHPTLYPDQKPWYIDELIQGHVIKDFPNMPMLDYSLLDKRMMAQRDKNWVGMITSIGCPYKCTFCVNSIVSDYNNWQAWSAERICDEIERARSYGFRNVFFWDDNFFVSKNRVQSFIRISEKRNLRFEWFAFTRSNHIDAQTFKDCYRIGLRRVSIGAESGSNRLLRQLQKGICVEETERGATVLNELGIEANYSYMIGLPGETRTQILATIDHIAKMGHIMKYPKITGPMLYCPYPGSKLYKECKSYGWNEPQTFEDWTDETTGNVDHPYNLPWIPADLKDMVSVYWLYSFLIPLSYKKIWRLWWLYKNRTKRGFLTYFFIIPIYMVASLGKLRHKLQFYKWPWETFLLKRFKVLVGA